MLLPRLVFGTLMIVVLLAVLVIDQWFAPAYPCFALTIGGIVWLAGRELGRLLSKLTAPIQPWVCGLGCVAIVLANWPAHLSPEVERWFPNFTLPFFVFVAFGMLTFLGIAFPYKGPGDLVVRLQAYLLVYFYIGCLGSFAVQTRWLGPNGRSGTIAFFLAVFTAKLCDMGAYFTGRAIGRTKMAPLLSPGKTWEGAVGGIIAGVLLALAVVTCGEWLIGYRLLNLPFAALFGAVVAIVAMIGDLMESLIKRDCNQKDASTKIPGFGGLLDVIDSILFSGPVAYALFRIAGL